MSFRAQRSKRSSNREPEKVDKPEKPKKKTLADACRDLKKTWSDAERQARYRAEEDAVLSQVYGPEWKEEMPPWYVEWEQQEAGRPRLEFVGCEAAPRNKPDRASSAEETEEVVDNVVKISRSKKDRREERKLAREQSKRG